MTTISDREYRARLRRIRNMADDILAYLDKEESRRTRSTATPLEKLAKGAFVDANADVAEHVKVIGKLLGDYRAAVAQLASAVVLEGPEAGKPKPTVSLVQQIEALAGGQASWPETSKAAATDVRTGRIVPTAESEAARRRAVHKNLYGEGGEDQ